MNILFVSHTGGIGGAETVLCNIICGVQQAMENSVVSIVMPNDGEYKLQDKLERKISGLQAPRFAYRNVRSGFCLFWRNFIYGLLFGLTPLLHYIKRGNFDVVYINSSANVIPMLAAYLSKKRFVVHVHEQSTKVHRWSPKWFNVFYRKILCSKRCSTIFVSETNYHCWLEDLSLKSIADSFVVYSKFEEIERQPSAVNDSIFRFGYIGSLNENKNIELLIQSFLKLPQSTELLIAGSGELAKMLEVKFIDNDRVKFLGHINEKADFYSKIDALVLPSKNESWGLVVMEAMSAGVSVIVTKNTGITEIFDHQKDCLFIDPASQNELYQAMNKIYYSLSLREELVHNAHDKLKKLKMNEKFIPTILNIINNG